MTDARADLRLTHEGFTLVEILVALAIGSIIIAGAYRSLTSQAKISNTEQLMLNLQTNVRMAAFRIAHDIRNAGYWGGGGTMAANTLNNSGTIDYAGDLVSWINNDNDAMNSYKNDADVIALRYSDPDAGNARINKMNDSSADIQLVSVGPFQDNDIVVVCEYTYYSIFQISQINVQGQGRTLVHNTGVGTPGNATKNLGYSYDENAVVYKLQRHTYWLAADDNRMSLMLKWPDANNPGTDRIDTVATNIEDLQFQYGWDQDGDGSVTDAEYADTPATSADRIRAVRVFILGRTALPADDYTDRNYYEYPNSPYYNPAVNTYSSNNGPGGRPMDGYRRYLISTVVALRNTIL